LGRVVKIVAGVARCGSERWGRCWLAERPAALRPFASTRRMVRPFSRALEHGDDDLAKRAPFPNMSKSGWDLLQRVGAIDVDLHDSSDT
jgi:hypothetical protein